MTKRALFLSAAGALVASVSVLPSPRAQEPVSFTKDIKPILENSCWTCHSGATQASKLDLSTRERALVGGERGPAIVPGRADDSRLYRLVAGLEQPSMPFDGSTLTGAQIRSIKTWINEGAHWDTTVVEAPTSPATTPSTSAASPENAVLPPGAREYWAFTLPVKAAVPVASARFKNPIDRFLEQARQAKGLKAAPRADHFTLLRRAYLDLIGMPPSPAPGAVDRQAARLATLGGTLGSSLARCGAVCRHGRLRGRSRSSEHVALPRLCRPLLQ